MNIRRQIRRLAVQALYQIDAHGGDDPQEIRRIVRRIVEIDDDESDPSRTGESLNEEELAMAADWAIGAWAEREASDALTAELAPGWPATRQPAMDRALLRLSHHEMAADLTPHKVVINEAVELAKQFGTERSPAFINGVLDKMFRRLRSTVEPKTDQLNNGSTD